MALWLSVEEGLILRIVPNLAMKDSVYERWIRATGSLWWAIDLRIDGSFGDLIASRTVAVALLYKMVSRDEACQTPQMHDLQ